MAKGIRDKVAILGMGCSKFGERWDAEADDLIVEAAEEALKDAGIETSQSDKVLAERGMDEESLGVDQPRRSPAICSRRARLHMPLGIPFPPPFAVRDHERAPRLIYFFSIVHGDGIVMRAAAGTGKSARFYRPPPQMSTIWLVSA